MTRTAWKQHMDELGLVTYGHRADPRIILARQHISACATCKARRRQARANRSARERRAALVSLGLKQTPYGWE